MKTIVIFVFMGLTTLTAFAHPGIGIVRDSKGNIFYTDLKQVWKIGLNGKPSVAVPNVHTHELFMDSRDNLYGEHLWYEGEKTDKWGTYVWQYNSTGQLAKLTGNVEGFKHGHSFCRDTAGNMYWIDRDKVEKYILRKTSKGDIEVLYSGKFTDIRWQFCQKDGTFYFIDDNDLYKLTPKKQLTLVAKDVDDVPAATPNVLSNGNNHSIYGIWDDPQGNLYVAVMSKNQIRKITKAGAISIVYESPLSWSPTGGVFDKEGDLWVLETGTANAVRAVQITQKEMIQKAVTGASWRDLLFDELYMALFLFFLLFLMYGFWKRKTVTLSFVAALFVVINGYSQTPATFGSFVASSPCGNVVWPLLKITPTQDCDFVKWKITLHQDPLTKAPTTFSLTAVYGLSQPSTTGFINGGTQVEATGKWLMTKGTQANPDAVVYQLNPDQPALSLSFVKMDDKIIHLLYNDKSLMIGNAGYSYTFNKAKN